MVGLYLDSSEGGLVARLKVILERRDGDGEGGEKGEVPTIHLVNARVTSGLVAKPLIEELRRKGVEVIVD